MELKRTQLLAGALALACSSVATPSTATPADGIRVYDKVCRYCHEAGVGPVIKGRQLPPEYVKRVVRFGNRAMPSFRPTEIDDAALAAVATLIASSTAGAPVGQ